MPVVSLWVEDGWPRVEIVGGTWVGDARDVGAGGLRHRQDLATVYRLWLLAKQSRPHEDGVRMCVEGVRKRTGLGKKKRKTKKKKCGLTVSLYIGLHGTGSSMPAVSLWVEGHGWSHAETMGGRGEGHARVMHAMWVEAVVVKTSRWRGNLIFWPGKKNNQKKKRKTDLPVQTPTKTPTSTGLACVVRV